MEVRGRSAVQSPAQELVSELPARIVLLEQALEIGQPRIAGSQLRGSQGEQLSPVRTDLVRCQLLLDHRKHLADGIPVLLPGEVDGQAGSLVARAHPQAVR